MLNLQIAMIIYCIQWNLSSSEQIQYELCCFLNLQDLYKQGVLRGIKGEVSAYFCRF